MEWVFPRPNEMHCVRFLELSVAGLGEAQPLLGAPTMAQIDTSRGYELKIVYVKPENIQKPREPREVAVYDLLQIRGAPPAPFLKSGRCEQTHANENIYRRHDLPFLQDGGHHALDLWRVVTKSADSHGGGTIISDTHQVA